ncbi:hypothetical protein J6590_057357 [Homalodisca vitripennis]|nr:hypothetical protein J6590_057357 [Homalodisca vitripennis]
MQEERVTVRHTPRPPYSRRCIVAVLQQRLRVLELWLSSTETNDRRALSSCSGLPTFSGPQVPAAPAPLPFVRRPDPDPTPRRTP